MVLFAIQFDFDVAESRDVSPGTSETGDESRTNGVGGRGHYNRNTRGRLLRGYGHAGSRRNDDVYLHVHKLGGENRKKVAFSIVWPIVNRDVVPLHPIQFAETSAESFHACRRRISENPDAVNFIDRLRVRCGAERKHHRTHREPENDGSSTHGFYLATRLIE